MDSRYIFKKAKKKIGFKNKNVILSNLNRIPIVTSAETSNKYFTYKTLIEKEVQLAFSIIEIAQCGYCGHQF